MRRPKTLALCGLGLLALTMGALQWAASEDTATPRGADFAGGSTHDDPPPSEPDLLPVRPADTAASRTTLKTDSPPEPSPEKTADDLFRVLVLGPGGQPLPGAGVAWASGNEEIEATTDAEGLASFPQPETPVFVTLRAWHGKLHASPRRTHSRVGLATLRLAPFGFLQGRVVDDRTEAPIEGALVGLTTGRPEYEGKTTSDDGGHFRFDDVPLETPGLVTVLAKGYPPRILQTELSASSGSPDLEIRLEPSLTIEGIVTDAVTGEPVPKATLKARRPNSMGEVRVDSEGRFDASRFVSRRNQSLTFEVEAEGYCSMRGQREAGSWQPLVRIRLIPTAQIHVTCVDAGGSPLRDIRLAGPSASSYAPVETPEALDGMVDEGWMLLAGPQDKTRAGFVRQGPIHRLERIPYTPAVGIRAHSEQLGTVRATLPAAGPPGSHEDFELRLTESMGAAHSTRLRGRLTIEGRPASGHVLWSQGNSRWMAALEADGSFELTNLRAGPGVLHPAPTLGEDTGLGPYFEEGMPFADERVQLTLLEGEVQEVDVHLSVPLGKLDGRLIGFDGAPLVDQSVWVHSEHPSVGPYLQGKHTPLARATTDGTGHYALTVPLALAPFRVYTTLGSDAHTLEAATAPRTGLDFVQPETGVVLIRARRRDGSPLGSMLQVHVRSEGESGYRRVQQNHALRSSVDLSKETMQVFLFDLPHGTYDILVGRPWELPHLESAVKIAAGEDPHELDVELESGQRLQVLLEETSEPIPEGITILLLEEELWEAVRDPDRVGGAGDPYPATTPRQARRLRTRDPSSLTLDHVRPGRYRFKVFPPDIAIEPEYVEVGSSDPRIEIRWK